MQSVSTLLSSCFYHKFVQYIEQNNRQYEFIESKIINMEEHISMLRQNIDFIEQVVHNLKKL
jgi:hypothetical protein